MDAIVQIVHADQARVIKGAPDGERRCPVVSDRDQKAVIARKAEGRDRRAVPVVQLEDYLLRVAVPNGDLGLLGR